MNVRHIKLGEVPAMLQWLEGARSKNCFDARVLDYPTLHIATVEVDGKAIVHVPNHSVLCLESAAINPETQPLERLQAAKAVVDALAERAAASGVKEIVFMSSDEKTDRHLEVLGFEKCSYMRKRI
jgi:hypothetical protein